MPASTASTERRKARQVWVFSRLGIKAPDYLTQTVIQTDIRSISARTDESEFARADRYREVRDSAPVCRLASHSRTTPTINPSTSPNQLGHCQKLWLAESVDKLGIGGKRNTASSTSPNQLGHQQTNQPAEAVDNLERAGNPHTKRPGAPLNQAVRQQQFWLDGIVDSQGNVGGLADSRHKTRSRANAGGGA